MALNTAIGNRQSTISWQHTTKTKMTSFQLWILVFQSFQTFLKLILKYHIIKNETLLTEWEKNNYWVASRSNKMTQIVPEISAKHLEASSELKENDWLVRAKLSISAGPQPKTHDTWRGDKSPPVIFPPRKLYAETNQIQFEKINSIYLREEMKRRVREEQLALSTTETKHLLVVRLAR